MAARFPQSSTSLGWRIKPAYSAKILALYWAAGADKLHRLRPGDTSTTILTRSPSGCTFDATNGVIDGVNETFFTDSVAGGIGGLTEGSDFTLGAGFFGDNFNNLPSPSAHPCIASLPPPDTFVSGCGIYLSDAANYYRKDGVVSGTTPGIGKGTADKFGCVALRTNASDATAKNRIWDGGAENTIKRTTTALSAGTALIGDSARPLYIGGSNYATGSYKKGSFECAFIGTKDLTDAELDAITANPAIMIEEAGSPTVTLGPKPTTVTVSATRTFTITRSAAAPAGGITYNLSSSATAVATVPATVTMTAGQTTATFDATGVSIGSATITATNAADSAETDSAAITVSAATVRTLQLLAHIDALGATSVKGAVFAAPSGGALTGAKIGEFSGQAFDGTAVSGQARLRVAVSIFGGASLTTTDTPVLVWTATSASGSALGNWVAIGSAGPQACTVVDV